MAAISYCIITNENSIGLYNQNTPKSASNSILNYGNFKYVDGRATFRDNFTWSFISSNNNVNITVMAMNSTNFNYFNTSSQPYTYISLSPGNLTSDNGIFSPIYLDTWYIVYLNNDTHMQSTTLSYNTTLTSCTPNILISFPSGTSSWRAGLTYDICWRSSVNRTFYVNISLYKDGNYYSPIAMNVYNNNSYFWTIPSNFTSSNSYQIEIKDAFNSNNSIISFPFYIIGKSSLQITAPTSVVSWKGGSSYYISWKTTSGFIPYVNIYLFWGGKYYATIASNIKNNGRYSWTTPSSLSSSGPFEIRVVDASNSNNYNISSNFYILSQTKTQNNNDYKTTNFLTSTDMGVWICLGALILILFFAVFISDRSKNAHEATIKRIKDYKVSSYKKSVNSLDDKLTSKTEQQSKKQNSNITQNKPLLENICPRCGILVNEGQKYCPECGQILIRDY